MTRKQENQVKRAAWTKALTEGRVIRWSSPVAASRATAYPTREAADAALAAGGNDEYPWVDRLPAAVRQGAA